MNISGIAGDTNLKTVNNVQAPDRTNEEAIERKNGTTEEVQNIKKTAEQANGLGNKIDLFA